MNPVATHSICSRSTPNVLIMCGRATLTMLESSTAMNVPSMMMPSTPHRLPEDRCASHVDVARRRPSGGGADVDPDLDGQPRADGQARRRRHRDAQRHALGDLDERAGNALGGNEAEFGIGGAQDLRHPAVQAQCRIGVDGDVHGVADGDLVQVLLLDVGVHAERRGVEQADNGLGGQRHGARVEPAADDPAVERRPDRAPLQAAPGVVHGRRGLRDPAPRQVDLRLGHGDVLRGASPS